MSRKEIIESVGDSLKNLQLDYIDLLIIHKNDPNCPIEGKKSGRLVVNLVIRQIVLTFLPLKFLLKLTKLIKLFYHQSEQLCLMYSAMQQP